VVDLEQDEAVSEDLSSEEDAIAAEPAFALEEVSEEEDDMIAAEPAFGLEDISDEVASQAGEILDPDPGNPFITNSTS
jgi:molecular chaperone DnaK